MLQDLPEYLLEDSGTDTEQNEEGEESASVVSCSPPVGRVEGGGDAWHGRHSANGEQVEEGVTAGAPTLQEGCDQLPAQLEPWSGEGSVGLTNGPLAPVCVHVEVQALQKELHSLNVLYHARGRKLEELSSALEAAVAERERCERVQSHQRGEVEVECAALRKEMEQLRDSAMQMAEENASLSRQLEEVQQVAVLMEEDRNEVCLVPCLASGV